MRGKIVMPKVVILAGGLGTRLSEATDLRPKPMVEIAGRPILHHIMERYAYYGFNEFVIALGYKGGVIKRYFRDWVELRGDFTVQIDEASFALHRHAVRDSQDSSDWTIHLVETGANTMTGGRLRRLASMVKDETFLLTYGDGVADVDLAAVLDHHQRAGLTATITAVRPPARFGGLVLRDDPNSTVERFTEKPQIGEGWINGGFMAFEPAVLDSLIDDDTVLEAHVLEKLAAEGQLAAYQHTGFWQCMDTIRDVRVLEALAAEGHPPWRPPVRNG